MDHLEEYEKPSAAPSIYIDGPLPAAAPEGPKSPLRQGIIAVFSSEVVEHNGKSSQLKTCSKIVGNDVNIKNNLRND